MQHQHLKVFLILRYPTYQVFDQKFSHDENHLECNLLWHYKKIRKNLYTKSKIFHHQQPLEFQYQKQVFEICYLSFLTSHAQMDTIPSKVNNLTMVLSILFFPMDFSVTSSILLFLLVETALLLSILKQYKNDDHKVQNPSVALDCI